MAAAKVTKTDGGSFTLAGLSDTDVDALLGPMPGTEAVVTVNADGKQVAVDYRHVLIVRTEPDD